MNIYDKMPMKFIKWAMDNGMQLTLEKDCINLNTGMKSQLHLYYEESSYCVRGRYGHFAKITTFWDLYLEVKNCMHGHSYMSGSICRLVDDGFGEIDFEPFE